MPELSKQRIFFALPATLVLLLVVLAMKMIWHVPNALLRTTALLFLASLIPFWLANRSPRHPAGKQVMHFLIIWLVSSGAFFGLAFRWDGAGWNWFRLTGYNLTLEQHNSAAITASVSEFLAAHPVFVKKDSANAGLLLPRGTYRFARTVIIPGGTKLEIAAGTRIRIAAGRSFISYSPIVALGTPGAPIVFAAADRWRKWGVVGVVSEGASRFEHVRFENGRQARVNGIDFPGTLTCIGGSVEIRNSLFRKIFGKDAVNIKYGNVLIEQNVFQRCFKDGLDLDGGHGIVRQNTFFDCDDEGIDLSENAGIEVFANTVLDARGGRIDADVNLDAIISANHLGFSSKN